MLFTLEQLTCSKRNTSILEEGRKEGEEERESAGKDVDEEGEENQGRREEEGREGGVYSLFSHQQ